MPKGQGHANKQHKALVQKIQNVGGIDQNVYGVV